MGHQVLILTAVVLLVMGVIGYWKGFLKMALSIAALVLSFVIVMVLNPYVSDFLQESTSLYQNTKNAVSNALGNQEEAEEGVALNPAQEEKIQGLPIPGSWKEELIQNYSEDGLLSVGAETFSEYVSSYVAKMILNVLAFLLTFVIVFIILHILMIAFDLIGRVPVIHGINKLAGAVSGLAVGLLILWMFNILISSAAATGIGWAVGMAEEIQRSSWLSFLYEGEVFSKLAELFL